jgi:hypothetical protein
MLSHVHAWSLMQGVGYANVGDVSLRFDFRSEMQQHAYRENRVTTKVRIAVGSMMLW